MDNYGNVGLRDVRVEFWEGGPPGSGRLRRPITVPELSPLATENVRIPVKAGHASLFYSWAIPTQETCDPQGPAKEHFTVSLRDANGQPLQVLDTLGECNATYYWELISFDARGYAVQAFQVHFQAITNEQLWTNFLVDDVRLDVCVRE
ncbi:MAG: hypothetical protein NT169_18855 [Chloroflexi bacterium]|nr:hypothetical protein [Chloroflexota bacterium]